MLDRVSSWLRSTWHEHRTLGILTAISLIFSALPLLFQRFKVADAIGIGVPLALLLMPRRPWMATAILSLGTAYSIAATRGIGTILAAWFAVYSLLREHRYAQTLTIVAALATGILMAWRVGQDVRTLFESQVLWLCTSLIIASALRSADTSMARAETARAEALRNQRTLIARELHDTLARANTQIVLRAQQAQLHLHDPDPVEQVTAALEDIVTTGHQSVLDLRTMLRVLRQDTTASLDPTPPAADLPTVLAQAEHDLQAAGLHATVTHDGDLTRLSPTLNTAITRILGECVANMIKYAATDAQCTIQLDITDTAAEILVINPLSTGRRATPATSSGLGLIGIHERTHALGGTTTITPTDHQWILHTTLPLTPKGAS